MNGIRRFNPTQLFNDGLLGQYSLGTFTGLIAAGTNGELFQFRWQDSLRIAAIRRVLITAVPSTPFGAAPATAPLFILSRAMAWTVQGTGGFAVDLTTGSGKRRTQMPTSLVQAGDIRIANTTALGGGTKTADSISMAQVVGVPVSAATAPIVPTAALLDCEMSILDYPLVLAANEGFTVNVASNPGTGTMVVSVSVEWAETNAS